MKYVVSRARVLLLLFTRFDSPSLDVYFQHCSLMPVTPLHFYFPHCFPTPLQGVGEWIAHVNGSLLISGGCFKKTPVVFFFFNSRNKQWHGLPGEDCHFLSTAQHRTEQHNPPERSCFISQVLLTLGFKLCALFSTSRVDGIALDGNNSNKKNKVGLHLVHSFL